MSAYYDKLKRICFIFIMAPTILVIAIIIRGIIYPESHAQDFSKKGNYILVSSSPNIDDFKKCKKDKNCKGVMADSALPERKD